MISIGRNDNLSYLPATILVYDTTDGKSAGTYVDALPYVTVAHTDTEYRIYNETDELLTLLILEQDIPVTTTMETLLAGATKKITYKNAFSKRVPTVLFHDLVSDSQTYDTYISTLGSVDITMENDSYTLRNDTSKAVNILIMT